MSEWKKEQARRKAFRSLSGSQDLPPRSAVTRIDGFGALILSQLWWRSALVRYLSFLTLRDGFLCHEKTFCFFSSRRT